MSSPSESAQDTGSNTAMESGMSTCPSVNKSPSGSRTPERPPSEGSPISDDTCPICLSHITDKCVANSCLHGFCLVCLKEWSKQKAVCPLCKLSFTIIMYDIKSESEYKEWKVPRPDPPERNQGIANFQEFLDAERRRFFGYRTTNFPGAATLRHLYPGRPQAIPDAIPSGPRERRPSRFNLRGSSMFRLSVYLNNVWVQPIADITGSYRQSSPDLYREQPALTHRLVPWVNRELAALLPSSRVGVVLAEVMDLIVRYSINSREFRRAMQVHLGRRTNHFVHEFYHFALSPYDMVGHDNAAQYVPRYGFNEDESSSSSSDDSDAVVEVDMRGNPVSANSGVETRQGPAGAGALVARVETLTQEGSVVISSDDSSSSSSSSSSESDDAEYPATQQSAAVAVPSTPTQPDFSETHNPEPPETCSMTRLLGRTKDFLSTINEGASTSRSEENCATQQQHANSTLKTEVSSDSEQSDSCIVIEEVKKRQKTPEIIDLESDEDEELEASSKEKHHHGKRFRDSDRAEQHTPSFKEKDNHWKKKISQDFIRDKGSSSSSNLSSNQHKKGRRKPTLKRTNFPLPLSEPSCSGSSIRRTAKEDHSYCDDNESASVEASTSNDRSESVQTSSIEISLKWHKSSKNLDPVLSVKKKDKQSENVNISLSSNDESSYQNIESLQCKYKDIKTSSNEKLTEKKNTFVSSNGDSNFQNVESRKHLCEEKTGTKVKHTSKSRDDPCSSNYSRHRVKSPLKERNSSGRHARKDHRSKIKSSLRSNSRHDTRTRNSFTNYHVSDSSSEAWSSSDRLLTPPSSKTESTSSWQEQSWDSQSRESSSNSKDSCYKDWKTDYTSSKSKHSSRKRKRKTKDRHKAEKSKKSKKSKHKRKVKSKKATYKISSSESDTESSEQSCKRSRKRKRIVSSSDSSDYEYKKKKQSTVRYSFSGYHSSPFSPHSSPGDAHSSF